MLLPAEWERQRAVWLTWPQNAATWEPVHAEARDAYRAALRAALRHQDVNLLVDGGELRRALEEEFAGAGPHNLEVLECPTNDSWIRDYGAITVRVGAAEAKPGGTTAASPASAGKLVALDFAFNSWGGKYPPWDRDDAVPVYMAGHRGRELIELDFVLEGGSIDANGRGKLLTTAQCLLNPNRNPGLNQDRIEAVLHHYLGIQEFLWLQGGIDGDDTDGHVDDLARFTDARTVFCAVEADARDENYRPLKENFQALERYAAGMDLEAVELPMPDRLIRAGLRTPATYLNFLILNGAVLVPVFRDKRDDHALQLFEKHFPGRAIVPLDCRALVFGQGAIHCSSMQEPAE